MRPSLNTLSDDLVLRVLDEAKRILSEVGMEIRDDLGGCATGNFRGNVNHWPQVLAVNNPVRRLLPEFTQFADGNQRLRCGIQALGGTLLDNAGAALDFQAVEIGQ